MLHGPLEKRIGLSDENYLSEGESRTIPMWNNHGVLEVDDRLSQPRVKTAAAEEAVAEALKVKPVAGRVYVLVIGLGSSEAWGTNNNGDDFPENALLGLPPKDVSMTFFDRYKSRMNPEYGYKTFMQAHIFEEHRNSNPKHAIGGVHSTHWNNRMRRVENLIYIERAKGAKWAGKVDRNEVLGTSMACRVPFDRCSICGNLAPTRVQYCGHLRPGSDMYGLRQIMGDGRSVSMINDFPRFFDESCVETPAAPEALMIMKVASEHRKQADIVKQDPELPLDVSLDDFHGLYMREPSIPPQVLEKLSQLGLPAAMKAAAQLSICFRPSEVFQMAYGMGALTAKQASDIDRKVLWVAPSDRVPFETIVKSARTEVTGHATFTKTASCASLLGPYAMSRSYQEPYLTHRLAKCAAIKTVPEHLSPTEAGAIEVYHAIYKAASGDFGYGPIQASLAWGGRHGGY